MWILTALADYLGRNLSVLCGSSRHDIRYYDYPTS